MGNCLRKRKKGKNSDSSPVLLQGQPRVSLWVESSDFSSVPDLDHFVEPQLKDENQYRPSTSSLIVSLPQDGYSTAPEDISEEEQPTNTVPTTTPHDQESRVSSEYLTSDEQESNQKEKTDTSWQALLQTLEATIDEDDSLQTVNRDERPLQPLSTPLRNNMLSPRIVEALADEKGRVRTKKIARFLQLREEALRNVR